MPEPLRDEYNSLAATLRGAAADKERGKKLVPARKPRTRVEGTIRSRRRKRSAVARAVPREVAVKALIEKGKKRGSLTYDEIAAISAAYDEDDPEKGNELVEEIMGQGIEITEMPDTRRGRKR